MNGDDAISDRLCSIMKIEDNTHKFLNTRFFELDLRNQRLNIYYEHPKDLPRTACHPYEEIDLNIISKVSDARKVRPKAGFCFCVTHAGDQMFIEANNENEMNRWIESLNAACRIVVKDVKHSCDSMLAPPNSSNKVAGGVIVTTENYDSGAESLEHNMPALSLPSIFSGYAVKQGALRKNWKKRYFVLDSHGFSYFKHDQEKEPIRTIPFETIIEARPVHGQHHPHRQNLFEVVTADRIYNVQCDNAAETKEWIAQINKQRQLSDMSNPPVTTPDVSVKPRPSSQEATKPSRAVWGGDVDTPDAESSRAKRHSKKSWQW